MILYTEIHYILFIFQCSGPSMEPTLYSNNILLTERITARFHKPNRGDIVIAVSPTNPDQYICKRVIGLPGDKVIIDQPPTNPQEVQNNNEPKNTTAAATKVTKTEDYVPRGYVWIEGDNQSNSADSRYYGPIPLGLIKSRAICRIWPLNEMKFL